MVLLEFILNYLLHCSTPPVQYSFFKVVLLLLLYIFVICCTILWLILINNLAIQSSKPNLTSSSVSHLRRGTNNMGNFTVCRHQCQVKTMGGGRGQHQDLQALGQDTTTWTQFPLKKSIHGKDFFQLNTILAP